MVIAVEIENQDPNIPNNNAEASIDRKLDAKVAQKGEIEEDPPW